MKKGFLIETLLLLITYGAIHCFVALISNNPSPDYDMSIELNLYTIISVYTYILIAITLNVIAFLYGLVLNKKKKILNYVSINFINLLFYYGSYIVLNLQMNRIIDIEQNIIISKGLIYIILSSVITIIFLVCTSNARSIFMKAKSIIMKNKQEIKKELKLKNK